MKIIDEIKEKMFIHEMLSIDIIGINTLVLFIIKYTISYEPISYTQITPPSSCMTIIQHNPFIGYIYIGCGVVLILSAVYRLYLLLRRKEKS